MQTIPLKIIARIQSDFPTKFGIPRQSGLVDSLTATVVFEPEFRNADSLRGLGDFSHLWLIWQFSETVRQDWSPTVRPPRLGGNTRMGVFATRSPFRPNPIGLSSVRIIDIEQTSEYGSVIHVAGADLMNGTPILDIKPYIPYTDCHSDASGGFTDGAGDYLVNVHCPKEILSAIPENKHQSLLDILSHDPRPSYKKDSDRIYGLEYAGYDIRFTVQKNLLTVVEICKSKKL